MYIWESGNKIVGPHDNGSWWIYAGGERFRITLRVNLDGTANVIYSRHYPPDVCQPDDPCVDVVFYEHPVPLSQYPFRVDASIRDVNATLVDVDIVRIRIP
jgi:hypothetical protein